MSSIMSSAQSSAASSTISGQPAATSSDSGSSLLTSQTTLYLYTFLVTLVVLFALTGGIIARSCMMRRRFRRRMEEAVRNGTVIPSTSRRPKVGEQPTLHDVWVKDVVEEDCSAEGSYWRQQIMPVAAMLTGLLHDTKATPAPTPRTLTSPSSISVNVIDWFRPNIVTVRRDMNRSTPVLTEEKEDASQPTEEKPYSAQVTVLIAMPVPHDNHRVPQLRKKAASSDGSSDSKGGLELPVVDFGIMEAVVKEPL